MLQKIAFLQSTKITLKVTDEMPIKDITKKKSCFCFLKKKSPKIHQAFFDVVGGENPEKMFTNGFRQLVYCTTSCL